MPAGPVVDVCSNCGAPLELDAAAKCIWCRAPVRFAPSEDDEEDDPEVMGWLEAYRRSLRPQYKLVPPEVCPSCGADIPTHRDGACFSCGGHSLPRKKRVPHLIAVILSAFPLLEGEPAIERYVLRAPREHSAILALTAAMVDVGVRFRAAYPDEDIRDSGVRLASADDIWMLDLTLDVMYMLEGELPGDDERRHQSSETLSRCLGNIHGVTRDRHWKRALRQAGTGPAQFQQLRAHVPPRAPSRR
jgi:hypothetical protein